VDSKICDPVWLKDRIAAHDLFSCFVRFDPNSNTFFEDASAYLDARVHELSTDLFENLYHPNEELVLRNLWALAEDPESLAIVARIAKCRQASATSLHLASVIDAYVRKKVSTDSWLLFLAACEPRFTQIPSGKHTDAFRLRYQLAILGREGTASVEILRLWRTYPKLSRLAYQRELKRAISGAKKAGKPWPRIGLHDFAQLTLDEKNLLCSDAELIESFLDEEARRCIDIERIKADRLRLRDARRIFRHYANSIKWGDYAKANLLMADVSIERLEPELKAQFGQQITSVLKVPETVKDAPYSPLTGNALKIARTIAGNLKVLDIISREPPEIVKALGEKKFKATTIPKAIAERLAQNWTVEEVESLCDSESTYLIRQVPEAIARKKFVSWIETGAFRKSDAVMAAILDIFEQNDIQQDIRTLFEKNSFSNLQYLAQHNPSVTYNESLRKVCIEHFGTGGEKVLAWTDDIEDLVCHYLNHRPISNRQAFGDKLVLLLVSTINRHHTESSVVEIAEALAKKDVVLWRKLAESLTGDRVAALIRAKATNQAWLMPLIDGRPDYQALHKAVCTDRVKISTSAAEVLEIVDQYPELSVYIEPQKTAGSQAGKTDASLLLSILAQRRKPGKLKELGKSVGQEHFCEACKQAVATRWITRRERGYLSLLSVLGSPWAKVIGAAMTSMKFSAPAGHKLDHLYHRYELPKDSGGKRPIAAPPFWIKRLQREVLEKIFNPLGAHDAVHGFVRGRSIKTNAILHVGASTVANCDITNCFPSIRWQLVLAALKRDLQVNLDPAAISLLVDLCTFDGALPIGAPTSPALLNRVLAQTDVWLSDAAHKRGAVYSRYADDLTFSGDNGVPELLAIARKALGNIGLKFDKKKTQIFRQGRRQIVTGLVVNERTSVPRSIRRKVRAAVHAVEHGRNPTWHGVEESLSALLGRTAFVRSINAEEGTRLLNRLREKLNQTSSSDDD
jgi:hypothetical protein